MSRSLQKRAATLALRAAEMLLDNLDAERETYDAQVEEWNAWLAIDGHDGSEDDAPEEPSDSPPLPDRHTLYACQVAAAAARQEREPGRPKSKPTTSRGGPPAAPARAPKPRAGTPTTKSRVR